ncbi:MAG: hypothetical protein Q7J64_06405 [Elusimicrobiota bacterium]|nr:hypothetical protein [Elusimicrobiota bacterium]
MKRDPRLCLALAVLVFGPLAASAQMRARVGGSGSVVTLAPAVGAFSLAGAGPLMTAPTPLALNGVLLPYNAAPSLLASALPTAAMATSRGPAAAIAPSAIGGFAAHRDGGGVLETLRRYPAAAVAFDGPKAAVGSGASERSASDTTVSRLRVFLEGADHFATNMEEIGTQTADIVVSASDGRTFSRALNVALTEKDFFTGREWIYHRRVLPAAFARARDLPLAAEDIRLIKESLALAIRQDPRRTAELAPYLTRLWGGGASEVEAQVLSYLGRQDHFSRNTAVIGNHAAVLINAAADDRTFARALALALTEKSFFIEREWIYHSHLLKAVYLRSRERSLSPEVVGFIKKSLADAIRQDPRRGGELAPYMDKMWGK